MKIILVSICLLILLFSTTLQFPEEYEELGDMVYLGGVGISTFIMMAIL